MAQQEYIYFLHDRTTDTVKIGMSIDPERRMKVIQSQVPLDLIPIRYEPVDSGYLMEHALHVQFAHLRVRGEWFRATPELLAFAQEGVLPELVPLVLTEAPKSPEGGRYTMLDLAEASGYTARTIRFYISAKVLHEPWERGRRASYDQSHLDRLVEITRLKDAGLALREIAQLPRNPPPTVDPHQWTMFPVAGDIQVIIQGQISPWRKKQILQAIGALERALDEINNDMDDEQESLT